MFESKLYRYIVYLLLISISAIYIFWAWTAKGGLLPVWSDEFFYYLNTRNFYENSTLRAALTYTGKGSLVFQADSHGFAYPLLHGTVAKLIGFHQLNIPFTNLFFVALTVVFILLRKELNSAQKGTIAVGLMTYLIIPLNTFTFIQESLQLFISVTAACLLVDIYKTRDPRKIVLYLFLLIIAGLFRNLWLFWIAGLLPLARNRKELGGWLFLLLTATATAFLISKLFWDSFPGYFTAMTRALGAGHIGTALLSLVSHFWSNVVSYAIGELNKPLPYYPVKLAIAGAAGALAYLAYLRRKPIYLACTVIAAINLGLLFLAYDAWDWREIRSMSPILYLFLVVVVTEKERFLSLFALVFMVATFPFVFRLTGQYLNERKLQAANYKLAMENNMGYGSIAVAADGVRCPLILFGYIPPDNALDILLVPLKTPSGKQIRYAVNYYGEKLNILDYDFILTNVARTSPLPYKTPVLTVGDTILYR